MAKLYISEYGEFPLSGGGRVPLLQEPALNSQVVNIGGSSEQSSPFTVGTKMLRVSTDANCSIKFGADPTATTNDLRLVQERPGARPVRIVQMCGLHIRGMS